MDIDKPRVCLLTGASGRLGTAFCRIYAGDYRIAGVYWKNRPAFAFQDYRFVDPLSPDSDLPENRHPVFAISADLTRPGEPERVIELTLARFGTIDLLINCAAHANWAPLAESSLPLETAMRQLQTNVVIPLEMATLCLRDCWRDRIAENLERNRNVINVSSTSSVRVYRGQGVYAASKAALNQLTLHMAQEFEAYGIRVNALLPESFPQIVETKEVAARLKALDSGAMAGILMMCES